MPLNLCTIFCKTYSSGESPRFFARTFLFLHAKKASATACTAYRRPQSGAGAPRGRTFSETYRRMRLLSDSE